MNEISYAFHYRNLDSTEIYARKALALADSSFTWFGDTYANGRAEALNNLAFVCISKMLYQEAYRLLDSIPKITDSQIELLVADVQYMRLCQRESHNKEFYDYHENALRKLHRIEEEQHLSPHEQARIAYARSEFHIVTSTYYYYVGLEEKSVDAINNIHVNEIEQDTAQYLAYLYNVGAGGIITGGTQEEICQTEFDHLMRCYLMARQSGYRYWEANSMQALSEHLTNPANCTQLIVDNLPAMKFLNVDQMPDSLLAGNLAQRSLDLFTLFGDVYQIAGSYRTLASCYFQIKDYTSAIICLEKALSENNSIEQAPDLVASIREQLSVAYSAIDDKQNSDFNRNVYLDLQEQTRQDRYLESRADQLNRSSQQLNYMMLAVFLAIITLLALLLLFYYLRQRNGNRNQLPLLMEPLKEWQTRNDSFMEELEEQHEQANEQLAINSQHLANNKRRHLEQRAKVSVVTSIIPFIDRMLHEIKKLKHGDEQRETRQERYAYIRELTQQINDYNDVLTEWIQMRQGELSLHIESFPLQRLFDIVKHGRMGFQLKGLTLTVNDTAATVKADRILTLFMLNTLADNARKFTPKGGTVSIQADTHDKFVEISIADTGIGLSQEQREHLFDYKPLLNVTESSKESNNPLPHGFGLMNCKGIIEKYKKISQIFNVCSIGVESEEGKGSRFFFRLPKGIARLLVIAMLTTGTFASAHENTSSHHPRTTTTGLTSDILQAAVYADSAYYSNINGQYEKTLLFSDSCRQCLNAYHRKLHPNDSRLMIMEDSSGIIPSEIQWYHDSIAVDYGIILDMRNETAVAALALHKWALYRYNNKVYTQLFKEISADNSLGNYVRTMQRSEINKTIAVILLVILLLSIFPAYYFIYYRHRLHERFCIDSIRHINRILLDNRSATEKLALIEPIATERFPEELGDIVKQIKNVLQQSVERSVSSQTNIELVQDNCRRVQMESDRLYISNNILDNCLSTLKHETMYYPSRIQQLIDGTDQHLEYMAELAKYYQELYTILCLQATRQVDSIKQKAEIVEIQGHTVYGDREMLHYLFSILKKQLSAGIEVNVKNTSLNDKYVVYDVLMKDMKMDEESYRTLFMPHLEHIPYLLCRQIVRDIGEATNKRGCGITAERSSEGVRFFITLAKATKR